jgi:aminoglycoside/choline kinase family phosphotransferase
VSVPTEGCLFWLDQAVICVHHRPMNRTPVELIELYWNEVWNDRNVELIREICADPILRHDAGSVTALSHEEQIARVQQQSGRQPRFTHEVLCGDGDHVVSVWNMETRAGEPLKLSGIEVFRATDGRLSHCWNSTYMPGFWGRDGDPSVPVDLPPPPLISSSSQIDRDWMQRALQAGGAQVPRIAMIGSIRRVGAGTMSETALIDIGYNADAADHPQSFICKISSGGAGPQAINAITGMFAREVQAYRFFGEDPGFRIPKLYYAASSEDGGQAILLLEALPQDGAGNQVRGCSIAEAEAVVRALTGLHHRYAGVDLSGEHWLFNRAAVAEALLANYATGAAIMYDRYAGVLSPQARQIIDESLSVMAHYFAQVPTHSTLIHSDARVDNIMFETASDGAISACLLDWQLARQGDPAFDLAYFLSGSLSVEDRRACEKRLITEHGAALADVFPERDPLAAYRANLLSGLQATVGAAVAVPDTEAGSTLLLALTERNCAAIADWGGMQACTA